MKDRLKNILGIIALIVVTGLVLYFALKDNYETIINEIINVNKIWLVVAFSLIFIFWFLKSIAMNNVVALYNKDYSIKKAFRLIIETNFFHAVTPFAVGGQPYEIYSLTKSKLKVTDATNVSIANFIVYQIALVLLGIVAITYNYFFKIFTNDSLLKHLVILGFMINLIVIVMLFLLTFSNIINRFIKGIIRILIKLKLMKENKLEKMDKHLEEFHSGAKLLLQSKKRFIGLIFIHFLSLIILYSIPFVLALAMGISSFNMLEGVVASSYVMLIGSFVPVPGGTGGLEYGFMVFYGNFIEGGKLNAIMLIWRFITYYFAMIVGAISLGLGKKEK